MSTASGSANALPAPSRLTADTRREFRAAVLDHLKRAVNESAMRISVDMGATREVDESGIGALLMVEKRAREQMVATRLLNAGPAVRRVLRLAGVEYLFEFDG